MRCVREYDRTRRRVGLGDLHGEVVGPLESPCLSSIHKMVAIVPLFAAGKRMEQISNEEILFKSMFEALHLVTSYETSSSRTQYPMKLHDNPRQILEEAQPVRHTFYSFVHNDCQAGGGHHCVDPAS